jgi:hypothetical protein
MPFDYRYYRSGIGINSNYKLNDVTKGTDEFPRKQRGVESYLTPFDQLRNEYTLTDTSTPLPYFNTALQQTLTGNNIAYQNSSITFTLNVTGIIYNQEQTFYITVDSGASGNTLASTSLSSSVITIPAGASSSNTFTVTWNFDKFIETVGSWAPTYSQIRIRIYNDTGPIVASSKIFMVPPPIMTQSWVTGGGATLSSVNEGTALFRSKYIASYIGNATALVNTWEITTAANGTNANLSQDITVLTTMENFSISEPGTYYVDFQSNNDNVLEQLTESISVYLKYNSVIQNTAVINVIDTSYSTVTVVPDKTIMDQNDVVIFTVTAPQAVDNTILLYFEPIFGLNTSTLDFTGSDYPAVSISAGNTSGVFNYITSYTGNTISAQRTFRLGVKRTSISATYMGLSDWITIRPYSAQLSWTIPEGEVNDSPALYEGQFVDIGLQHTNLGTKDALIQGSLSYTGTLSSSRLVGNVSSFYAIGSSSITKLSIAYNDSTYFTDNPFGYRTDQLANRPNLSGWDGDKNVIITASRTLGGITNTITSLTIPTKDSKPLFARAFLHAHNGALGDIGHYIEGFQIDQFNFNDSSSWYYYGFISANNNYPYLNNDPTGGNNKGSDDWRLKSSRAILKPSYEWATQPRGSQLSPITEFEVTIRVYVQNFPNSSGSYDDISKTMYYKIEPFQNFAEPFPKAGQIYYGNWSPWNSFPAQTQTLVEDDFTFPKPMFTLVESPTLQNGYLWKYQGIMRQVTATSVQMSYPRFDPNTLGFLQPRNDPQQKTLDIVTTVSGVSGQYVKFSADNLETPQTVRYHRMHQFDITLKFPIISPRKGKFVGYISGPDSSGYSILTVTSKSSGRITPGSILKNVSWNNATWMPYFYNTWNNMADYNPAADPRNQKLIIAQQLTGTAEGVGTYKVYNGLNYSVSSSEWYIGHYGYMPLTIKFYDGTQRIIGQETFALYNHLEDWVGLKKAGLTP